MLQASIARNLESGQQLLYPGDECCTLYDWRDWTGPRATLCIENQHRTEYDLNQIEPEQPEYEGWNMNDRVSSWYCGKNVKYSFCDNGSSDCQTKHGAHGAGLLMNQNVGWDEDYFSTVVLEPYDVTDNGVATLFEEPDCAGRSAAFEWNGQGPDGVFYNQSHMWYEGMRNDRASSVAVPYGYKVDFYRNSSFTGIKSTVTGSFENAEAQRMRCVNFVSSNDNISSLRVQRSHDHQASGYWESITSTNPSEFTYRTGATSTTQTYDHDEIVITLNMAMALGFDYLVENASYNFSANYKQTAVRDVTSTFTEDYSLEQFTTCGDENSDPDFGHGMYQWVVKTDSGNIKSYSGHTVCRTGANWNQPPACPWFACVNAECTVCHDDWLA